MTNQSKLAKSEVCQKCAKCCKFFSMFIDKDTALRLMWSDLPKGIIVEEVKTHDDNFYYLLKFMFSCKKLVKKEGLYFCSVYDKRPHFCKEYPSNLPISMIEHDAEFCKVLKNNQND